MHACGVKITESLYLNIVLNGNVLERCYVSTKSCLPPCPDTILRRFDPYLKGEGEPLFSFEELNLSGYTQDAVRVYRVLRKITEPGGVITYGDLGKLVGRHPRFVAYCMRINRFPILIPCHRVVSKDGLGGYSYGVDLKRKLLELEGRVFAREFKG